MPEIKKIRFAEWLDYECRALKQASSEIKWMEFLWSGGAAMISGGFAWFEDWNNYHDTKVVILSALVGFMGVFLIQFLVKLLAAPVKMENDAEAKSTAKQATLSAEKEDFENQIKPMQTELDTREKRRKIKESLAEWRLTLAGYHDLLLDVKCVEYNDKMREELGLEYDKTVCETASFLEKELGKSAVTTFVDNVGIEKVQVPEMAPYLVACWTAKHSMLNRLKYRIKQLQKIDDGLD
jgi:hypothetical protein